MQMIKYTMLFFVLLGCSVVGRYLAKKYVTRVEELEEMRNALNMLKVKIKFTYEPIPEIFKEIAQNTSRNIGKIFMTAQQKMSMFSMTAGQAWEESIEESKSALQKQDKHVLKTLSKLLGQTDVEGQVSQIEITQKFLETGLEEAQKEREKNEKLYGKLGITIGLAIVIILC